jgi:hypothetical protein
VIFNVLLGQINELLGSYGRIVHGR